MILLPKAPDTGQNSLSFLRLPCCFGTAMAMACWHLLPDNAGTGNTFLSVPRASPHIREIPCIMDKALGQTPEMGQLRPQQCQGRRGLPSQPHGHSSPCATAVQWGQHHLAASLDFCSFPQIILKLEAVRMCQSVELGPAEHGSSSSDKAGKEKGHLEACSTAHRFPTPTQPLQRVSQCCTVHRHAQGRKFCCC